MRSPDQRRTDILDAADAIARHCAKGDLQQELVFDAVQLRLLEIGEAVKNLPPDLVADEPHIPWDAVRRMRDVLAHHYFDVDRDVIARTVERDLPMLVEAVERLRSTSG